ncbi:MAG TPA: 2-(1,2-epoxy-1,2-dihydrophenyl)acetyl-CoA isomerase PaaG [Gemmatimonadaceae bacterium]|nr:2-(1,2-epoxy-1,2-dihydrophenyl)acetyl-CoA isomerase PaaG [Gemmatimonadaceae bacterium]
MTEVGYEVADGVATLTLDRPEVLNSFNRPMAARLQASLDRAAADEAVRALLLTGAGRGFCAGQDLAEAMPQDGGDPPTIESIVRGSYNPIVRRLRAIEKPIVCAVNGVAAGAGANIALACDFVLAAEHASFVQAFSKIGLIPDSGGTFLLPRLVGLARATALTMLGEKLTAAEALSLGLVYRVVPGDALLAEARALAGRLAEMPTRGLGLTKRALNAGLVNDLARQLEVEAELQGEAGRTEDYREGVAAFLGKRKAEFRGR